MNGQRNLTVVVTGDLTIDWTIHHRVQGVHMCPRPGGAMLLADLIRAAAEADARRSSNMEVRVLTVPQVTKFSPDATRYHHTYAQLTRDSGTAPWRVEEVFGLDCQTPETSVSDLSAVEDDTPEADVVVIDDADLGFREESHRGLWPSSISAPERMPWVLLKTRGRRIAQGALWEHLRASLASRLVVVTTIADIRLAGGDVSRGLSWERTARALAGEVLHNPRINALSNCAYAAISFGPAGAILLANPGAPSEGDSSSRVKLFFDPELMEDTKPTMPRAGYTSALAAAMCMQILRKPERLDMDGMAEAMRSGLATMGHLQQIGLSSEDCPGFPAMQIAETIGKDAANFADADVPRADLPVREYLGGKEKDSPSGYWTILDDNYPDDLDILAERIVVDGPEKTLKRVPLGRFGGLLTVDRQEIESLRSIRTLVDEYLRADEYLKRPRQVPLSIAVFGAPGSGKSYTVTQVINSLPGVTTRSNAFQSKTFNLAQFNSPDALVQAMHQVRDLGLSGSIPLIFWDEIDSKLGGDDLGWLRYFLAPMQDGMFQEGQIAHPIGRSIFVFAGGTSRTLEEFRGKAGQEHALSNAKVPDFLSRLRGYIEILSPDPESGSDGRQVRDPYFIVRRALLLRSLLDRKAPHLFESNKDDRRKVARISSGVLRGFLTIPSYKHGARSMEAIIDMSLLAGQTSFAASCLPTQTQLDLHVDGNKFLSIIREVELPGKVIENLTDDAYADFCEVSEGNIDFLRRLGGDEKKQVRRVVRGVTGMLEEMGYRIVPADRETRRISKAPSGMPSDEIERMASLQHSRWMKAKLAAEWSQGREVDKERRTHPALKRWEELAAPENENWRKLIGIVLGRLSQSYGYAIVRYAPDGPARRSHAES